DFEVPGVGGGATFYVGQQYFAATGGMPNGLLGWMDFYDNGQCIGGAPISGAGPVHGVLMDLWSVDWVPTTAETHTITASDGTQSKSTTVTVLPAAAGSTPMPQPKHHGCGILAALIYFAQTGSGQSGSAGGSNG
ncbi:hypothetical protein, partial [Nocardia sp. NPDC050789]